MLWRCGHNGNRSVEFSKRTVSDVMKDALSHVFGLCDKDLCDMVQDENGYNCQSVVRKLTPQYLIHQTTCNELEKRSFAAREERDPPSTKRIEISNKRSKRSEGYSLC